MLMPWLAWLETAAGRSASVCTTLRTGAKAAVTGSRFGGLGTTGTKAAVFGGTTTAFFFGAGHGTKTFNLRITPSLLYAAVGGGPAGSLRFGLLFGGGPAGSLRLGLPLGVASSNLRGGVFGAVAKTSGDASAACAAAACSAGVAGAAGAAGGASAGGAAAGFVSFCNNRWDFLIA